MFAFYMVSIRETTDMQISFLENIKDKKKRERNDLAELSEIVYVCI